MADYRIKIVCSHSRKPGARPTTIATATWVSEVDEWVYTSAPNTRVHAASLREWKSKVRAMRPEDQERVSAVQLQPGHSEMQNGAEVAVDGFPAVDRLVIRCVLRGCNEHVARLKSHVDDRMNLERLADTHLLELSNLRANL